MTSPRRQRGYGARVGPGSVRQIVIRLAKQAGYDPERDQFLSTHAFRHWDAQTLIDIGASIDQVQAVLGHARAQTTKDEYAPVPFHKNGRQVGQISSSTFSPILKKSIALGSVEPGYRHAGAFVDVEITVEYHRRTVQAEIVPTPFFSPPRKKA